MRQDVPQRILEGPPRRKSLNDLEEYVAHVLEEGRREEEEEEDMFLGGGLADWR